MRKNIVQQENIGEKLLHNCMTVLSFTAEDRVSGYIPIDGEIDVLPLMRYCLNCCSEVFIPVVVKGSRLLKFVQWLPTSDEKRKCGTSDMPNILFVPLVAFDKELNRLGLGGGFYDYTIEVLRKKKNCKFIGVAYELQLCENIPVDVHDQKLDLIVTEQAVYY